MNSSLKILVVTPVRHISGVCEILNDAGVVTYFDDPSLEEVIKVIAEYDAIFTNPNKSKVFISKIAKTATSNIRNYSFWLKECHLRVLRASQMIFA